MCIYICIHICIYIHIYIHIVFIQGLLTRLYIRSFDHDSCRGDRGFPTLRKP